MKKRQFNIQMLCLCTIGVLGMSSCVDNDYNLSEDVDMNVTVGGDVTLPGSDTEEITLKKIFDLEDDCIVKADPETGDYRLTKDAEPSLSDVTIESVRLNANNIDIDKNVTSLHFKHQVNVEEDFIVEQEVNETSSFSLNKDDVTTDLVTLSEASLQMNSKLHLSFQGNEKLNKLGIHQGFRIDLPDYMEIESTDSRCHIIDNHILEFKQDLYLYRNHPLDFDLRIVKMNFTNVQNQGLIARGVFAINDEITISGSAFVANSDLKQGDIDLKLESSIDMNDIELVSIAGTVDPNIEIDINPVDIDNLPDFLTDEEVRINLSDPRIFLTISNESPVSVNLMATLIPTKDGHAIKGNEVKIGDATDAAKQIIIPANAKNYTICVHQTTQHSGIKADAFVSVANLTKIVEIIPEQIQIEDVTAKALPENITVNLGKTYHVNTSYEFNCPLQFNEGTTIVYTDNMDGWTDDTKDIEIKKAVITLDAENAVPMNMELQVDAIDADGNIKEDITTEIQGNIAAGLAGKPAVSPITISLTSKAGSFKNLDGIRYRVTAATDAQYNGVNLNEKQALILNNIKIKVIGGVSVDLN